MIPKKIHYCWFGPKPLPKLAVNCLETWKRLLPAYELNLWDESNSPMQSDFVRQAYAAKKYAFVSDYVRFWVLFKHGGIYLDTDIFLIRSFDDLLNNEAFFAWETDQKMILSCGVIGANPKQEFINKVLMYYEHLQFNNVSIANFLIPGIVTSCYADYLSKEEVTIYPYDYFYPFPYEEKENIKKFMEYKTENTYAVHLWNVSWGRPIDKLRDRILYHIKRIKNFKILNEKK